MKTKRFAPKDAKLIKEHPNTSPDELLKLGLSKKAYERLAKQDEVLQPLKVEQVQKQKPLQIVRMANKRTGRVVRIGYKAAAMLSTKYPKEFKIL